MSNLIVDFEPGGSYAPCMVIFSLRNKRERERLARHVESRGGIPADDRDAGTGLMSYEDAAHFLTPAQYRDLDKGWPVGKRMSRWEALQIFGYDSGDILA